MASVHAHATPPASLCRRRCVKCGASVVARGVPTTRSCLRHFRVGSNGFRPTAVHVTSLTALAPGEPHHVRPHFFAGTRQLLYRVTSDNGRNNAYYVTSLDAEREKAHRDARRGQRHLFPRPLALHAEPYLDGSAIRCEESDDRLGLRGPSQLAFSSQPDHRRCSAFSRPPRRAGSCICPRVVTTMIR